MATPDNRIPVTLLTGFLGAGKTTVLNHLIRDPEAGRIAVIMNELGDAGLDHDLIEESTEDVVLMQSGCLCCSIRGDLANTFTSLFVRRERGELRFDRVVIETTGIADPGPILHTMVIDDLIAPNFRLDGVVSLADAATGPRTLDAQFEAVSQIAMADLIVLTKTDLVTPTDLKRFKARLEGINGTAQRITAQHGQVPIGALFGLSAMRGSATANDLLDWLGSEKPKPDPLAGLSGFEPKVITSDPMPLPPAGTHFHHDSRIGSASIEVADPIPARVFDLWLETLVELKGPDILRMKGIIHVQGMEWPFVFHGVQHIFDAPVPLKSWTGNDTTSRIVVISRDIEKGDLIASLEMLQLHSQSLDARVDGMMTHVTEMQD
ncbi:GTP-binding protein [Ruegeria sp. SCPT10]|uniref:CobW family GTP-binding protein n=1 Tax=Ruegeria sp. SCP10 TaxID=3141377 RepID=UPI00333AA824